MGTGTFCTTLVLCMQFFQGDTVRWNEKGYIFPATLSQGGEESKRLHSHFHLRFPNLVRTNNNWGAFDGNYCLNKKSARCVLLLFM